MSKTTEIYQKVTDAIVSKLESAGSWQKLWNVPTPMSLMGRPYQGINFMLLSSSKFAIPVFGTYNQIRKNGGQVKKGEKSEIVVFWDKIIEKDINTDKTESKFFLKMYHVFNVSQADFDEIGQQHINKICAVSESQSHIKSVSAEKIIENMPDPPKIVHDLNDQASYSRVLDRIRIPEMRFHKSPDEYFSTLYHEAVHATGHTKRLNRFESYKEFNDSDMNNYSKEELVAELGAAYLCCAANLKNDLDNSAAYLKGWCSRLKENTSWIVWASKRAETAADYILNQVPAEVSSLTPEEAL